VETPGKEGRVALGHSLKKKDCVPRDPANLTSGGRPPNVRQVNDKDEMEGAIKRRDDSPVGKSGWSETAGSMCAILAGATQGKSGKRKPRRGGRKDWLFL